MEFTAIRGISREAREVEDNLREHLTAFGRGDFETWGSLFSPDVFFTTANPDDVFSTRDDAIAEMHRDFDWAIDEGLQIAVEPLSFRVGISGNGQAAWTAAPLRCVIRFQGESSSFVLRHTSVLCKSGRRWFIRATHYSLALPQEKVLQALMTGILPDPQWVGNEAAAGTQALVGSFRHQLGDFSRAVIHPDAHAFGPFPEEEAEGEADVRALFAQWTSKWGMLRLRPNGVRAEFTSSDMGWVSANVEAVLSYAGQRVCLPLRALVVYQKDGSNWSLVHSHLSVGIPDELAE